MNNTDVIICIDDESVILKLIKAQLENHFGDQYRYMLLSNAEDAYEAVIKLKENKENLVMAIVDQILPGQQGTKFLTELSKIFPNTVKILFSGKSDFSAVIQAINEAEIFRYLIKPWNEVDFLNIVDRGLKQYYIKENIELQLAEIHHRVKNNLTIITCLLELQISELKDEASKYHFQQSINRINSIAQVHELIYASEDMASVDIKEYLEKIIPAIQVSLDGFKKEVNFNLLSQVIN
jgi:two-component sensor histidine kinase